MSDALFAVDTDRRTIRGLLLPYGELSSASVSGTEPVMFEAGTVTLPADPSIVTLNEGHDALEPRGRAISLEETPEGIVAEFAIAATPEGDALLERAGATPRPRLSAEIRSLVRQGTKALSASLRGAAVVPVGAFQSAALFAALDAVLEAPPESDEDEPHIERGEDTAQTTEAAPVAADNTEGDEPEADEEESDMTAPAAVVPAGLTPPAQTKTDTTSADGLFAALATAQVGGREALTAYQHGDALFAISTIQDSGPSSKTIGADTMVPQYVHELWKSRPYERRFVPLFNHANLTSLTVVGWRWTTPPVVADYAGNTAEIPSNAVDTEPVTTNASRLAGGHKLDRRFIDFNDTSVYQSYFAKMTESYARVTDSKVLAAAVAAGTTVTPGTVPSGIAKGLAAVVDGALGVIATDNSPSFAIVSPELWRDIALTGSKDVLGYLGASLGLEDGQVAGFKIISGNVGTGKVLVGAKEAMTVYELPGAPIRVEGIDPHHGAIDPALFGYLAIVVSNAAALSVVTVA